jgi:hypothetical protein
MTKEVAKAMEKTGVKDFSLLSLSKSLAPVSRKFIRDKEEVGNMARGGSPSAYFLVFFFLSSSMMLLLRRRWIDVEKVPFPHVLAAYETIRRVKSSTEPSGRGSGSSSA